VPVLVARDQLPQDGVAGRQNTSGKNIEQSRVTANGIRENMAVTHCNRVV